MDLGCGTVPVQARTTDVRLEIVARALARAERQYAIAWSNAQAHGAAPEPWEVLRHALDDVQQSLFDAERAIGVWDRGDPRAWVRARPCLVEDLDRVNLALLAVALDPPPGLSLVLTRAPSEVCLGRSYRP
jgi:hypothetical protein